MAISQRAAGTWADAGVNGTSITLTIPAGATTGDLMLAAVVIKPYTADPTIDQGWSTLYKGASGTTANGNGAGSQEHAIFYKVHTGTESNPTVTFGATSSPGGGVIVVLQKGAGETWNVGPLAAAVGEQAMGTTALSIGLTTDAAITSGDWIWALVSAGDDSATFTRATTAISGGPTYSGNHVEYPATHLSTTTGSDAAMDLGYRVASSSVASGQTITVTATLSAAERAAASIFYVRVQSVTTVSGSFTSDAYIKKTTSQSFTADSYIKRIGIAQSITADAYIRKTFSNSITADATISKVFSNSITADAFIKKTSPFSITADAFIKRTFSVSFTADAFLRATTAGSFTADAYIVGDNLGAPTWVSPANGSTMSATPTLVFTIPTGPAGNYHFHIQLDTANTFDTGNLRNVKTNISTTGWEYFNGSTWTAFPSGGVASTYSGNEARYTVQSGLSNATWYRRVRGGMA